MNDNHIKQVIIIRKDLKMRRGKEIAQGAHASMVFLSRHIMSDDSDLTDEAIEWLKGLFTKIVLQCDSEEEMRSLHQKAKEKGLTSHLITDSGLTEFNGVPTLTALAIGPNRSHQIDEITEHLKLY